jgi:hypothetical protein
MTQLKRIKFILLLMVMILNKNFGQEVKGHERSGSQNVVCESSSSYGFLVDGVYFTSGKNVSICGDKFPVHIVAVTSNKVHVNDPEMVWYQANGTYSPINGLAENFIYLDYLSSEGKLKLQYSLPNNQGASITIHQLHKVEIKKSETTKYAFDDNKIPEYPYYDDGKPYKFLSAGKSDNVVMDVNVLAPASYPLSFFRDQKLNYSKKSNILTLSQRNTANTDSIYMMSCDTIKVMKVDIYPEKTLDVNIYTLAETDDDIANYCIDKDGDKTPYEVEDSVGYFKPDCKTRIDSKDWECILPGPDGSLDLFDKPSFWRDKDNDENKDKDSVNFKSFRELYTLRIFAGSDKFCNEKPLSSDTSSFIDMTNRILNISDSLNIIYNAVGIKIKVNYLGVKYFNFDSKDDLGKGKNAIINDPIEQNSAHLQIFGGVNLDTLNLAPKTTLFFVPEMIKVRGRATAGRVDSIFQNLANSLFVDANNYGPKTIAHELGHARFNLFHPDGTHCEDKDDIGYTYNGLRKRVTRDEFNIMNSGCFSRGFIFRRFQWKIIHSKI